MTEKGELQKALMAEAAASKAQRPVREVELRVLTHRANTLSASCSVAGERQPVTRGAVQAERREPGEGQDPAQAGQG